MSRKIGLKGFSEFRLFPVISNTVNAYEVGAAIDLKEVQEMTRENDTSEQKVYADDTLYMNIKNFNGIKASIVVAELNLALRAVLGDGMFEKDSGIFKWFPDGIKPSFACSYKVPMAGGGARLYRMFVFQVEEVVEAGHKTAGANLELQPYKIMGTFVKRKFDGCPGEVMDVADLSNLSFIEMIENK